MIEDDANRRPIAARETGWARAIAARLARTNITPNQISMASVLFAALGAAMLVWWPTIAGLLLCALCIQLRLLCNLIDGMVAVEGGKASPLGRIYNEFPDRITDTLFIVAAGYAADAPWLGWLGAVFAVGTAYVRVFGGSLGLVQDFRGPVAKQQRMALLTLGCLVAAGETYWQWPHRALFVAGTLVAAGSLLTCATRTRAIVAQLNAKA
jgi:phosphatidylglycerophosphate synthase